MPSIPEPLLFLVSKNDTLPDTLVSDMIGERDLSAAVLRQARLDLKHTDPYVRSAARRFWQDAHALQFWAEVIGVEPAVLRRKATRLLATASLLVALTLTGCVPQRSPAQTENLRLFFEELHWRARVGVFSPGCSTDDCA